ncbi:Unconventional myosin-VIIb [Liparis tanakae]|uniref:Unconventional myosin-VIIb n=1 Tax=Liparis tanakae TaxID=230148 RepID=A0A4Z2GMY8_9TELE|nr:Unconventional myosin-VIIb [Liparis tanakae]
MAALIERNLDGLRQRSVYAMARQDASRQDDPTFQVCKRGDLLLVEKDKTGSPGKDWMNVTNQRTSASGAVHKDTVQFLPTLEKPTDVMMELLSPGQRKPSTTQNAMHRNETVAPTSLKEFAFENFR